MNNPIRKYAVFFTGLFLFSLSAIAAANQPAIGHPAKLPPDAQLQYKVQANYKGVPLSGTAEIKWMADQQKGIYSIKTKTKTDNPLLIQLLKLENGELLATDSEGTFNSSGLAPKNYGEKSFSKPGEPLKTTTITFDHETKKIRFSASEATYPLTSGEQDQDHTSAIWQLLSWARAAPKQFIVGSEWTMPVAGKRDVEPWTFTVEEVDVSFSYTSNNKLKTIQTLQLAKTKPHSGQQINIWLAPTDEWYPVRITFINENGLTIDQTLINIEK